MRKRVLAKNKAVAMFEAANCEAKCFYLTLSFAIGARTIATLELTLMQMDVERRRIRLNPEGRAQNKKRCPIVPRADVLVPWISATGNYGGKN